MVDAPLVQMTVTSDSPATTRDIAAHLGRVCRGGEILLLDGDLGSGKTCFVQGLARGLDVDSGVRVTSPTFTIHAEYAGRLVLNHLDLYRLDDPVSQAGLGIDDMLGQPDGVAAIEWPEMLADPVLGDRLEIRLHDIGDGCRRLEFAAFGPRHARLIEESATALSKNPRCDVVMVPLTPVHRPATIVAEHFPWANGAAGGRRLLPATF